jgi:tetratricopeptide (TPR) repeat protein
LAVRRRGESRENGLVTTALLLRDDPFQRSLSFAADYFDTHYNLGNVFATQGDFRAAAEQFGEAAKINPDDANAQANLGSALAAIGQLNEAKSHYEAALRIGPSNQPRARQPAGAGAADKRSSLVRYDVAGT